MLKNTIPLILLTCLILASSTSRCLADGNRYRYTYSEYDSSAEPAKWIRQSSSSLRSYKSMANRSCGTPSKISGNSGYQQKQRYRCISSQYRKIKATSLELESLTRQAAENAALELCSTRECYQTASDTAFNEMYSSLEQRRRNRLIRKHKVVVHRGRWWPELEDGTTSFPHGILTPFFHKNGFFEDFDLVTRRRKTWQKANPQLPDFLAANTIYVEALAPIRRNASRHWNPVIVHAKSYAVAGKISNRVCVAPFALSVCSLLNNSGEYNREKSCLYERYFTEENRYCEKDSEGNVTECGLVPGSLYRAFPKDAPANQSIDSNTDLVMNAESSVNFSRTYCDCPAGAAGFLCNLNCGRPGGPIPMTDYLETRVNFTCDFKSSPNPQPEAEHPEDIESPADFFGLVGMPVHRGETHTSSGLNPADMTSYQSLLNSMATTSGGYCLEAKIGDDFQVLEEGLSDSETAAALKTLMSSDNINSDFFGNTFDVIYHSLLTRDPGLLPTHGGDRSNLLTIHEELQCGEKVPNTRHGICNSQLFRYDTRCLEKQGMTSISESSSAYIGDVLYSENMIACPNDETSDTLYSASNINRQKIWDRTNFLTNNDKARTWKVAVPIIAPKHANDMDHACAGILSKSAPDPIFKVGTKYTVVGFTEVVFYDHDIAEKPPTRGFVAKESDSDVMKANYEDNKELYEAKAKFWKENLWSDDEMYWGFQDDESETPDEDSVMCNMIKGAQTCNQGLLSVPLVSPQAQDVSASPSPSPLEITPSPTPAPLAGDYNCDGTVNSADYTVWRNNLGSLNADACSGDGDNDGDVDSDDYQVWRQNFGASNTNP